VATSGLRSACSLNILGFESFVARDDLEDDVFTFVQRLETHADDGRVMHEHILAGFLGDEAKTFFIVEPLYFATSHTVSPDPPAQTFQKSKRTPLLLKRVRILAFLELHMAGKQDNKKL
jgi:hypothetical protein